MAKKKRRPKSFRRTDAEIHAAWTEMHDILKWHRYHVHRRNARRKGKGTPETPADKAWRTRLEKTYGRQAMIAHAKTDFDWGLLTGRFSALSWLEGCQWDESMDT